MKILKAIKPMGTKGEHLEILSLKELLTIFEHSNFGEKLCEVI